VSLCLLDGGKFCIASGGDDQAVCWCLGQTSVRSEPASDSVDDLRVERITSASGSAIKSIRILSLPSNNGVPLNNPPQLALVYVGYDQRVNMFEVSLQHDKGSSALSAVAGRTESNQAEETPSTEQSIYVTRLFPVMGRGFGDLPATKILRWVSGSVVTVGDVADLDACLLTDHAGYRYLVSIVGEGLELLSLDANINS
jgi:hypothetical protein